MDERIIEEINYDDLQNTIVTLHKALNSSRVSVQDLTDNLQKFSDTARFALLEKQQ